MNERRITISPQVVVFGFVAVSSLMMIISLYFGRLREPVKIQHIQGPELPTTRHLAHLEIFIDSPPETTETQEEMSLFQREILTVRYLSIDSRFESNELPSRVFQCRDELCVRNQTEHKLLHEYPDSRWFIFTTGAFHINITNIYKYTSYLDHLYHANEHLVMKSFPSDYNIINPKTSSFTIKSRALVEFQLKHNISSYHLSEAFGVSVSWADNVIGHEILTGKQWMEKLIVNSKCDNCRESTLTQCFGEIKLLSKSSILAWSKERFSKELAKLWYANDELFYYYDQTNVIHICAGNGYKETLSLKYLQSNSTIITAHDVPKSKIDFIKTGNWTKISYQLIHV